MSMQVGNREYGNVALMFARQSAPAAYDRHRATTGALDATRENDRIDRVVLSDSVPKPLSADMFEDASEVGQKIASGERLSPDSEKRIREDRVFRAVSALALFGESGNDMITAWPGGLPAPSREEMEAAKRRLSQRLDNPGMASDPESVQLDRMELMRKIGTDAIPELSGTTTDSVGSAPTVRRE